MKQGRTLKDLAATVQAQAESTRDFVAQANALTVVPTDRGLAFSGLNGEDYALTRHANSQLQAFTEIHASYYKRCLGDAPELLAENVNHWLHEMPARDTKGKKVDRMVRTIYGNTARALVSSKYNRSLDNFNLAKLVLEETARRNDGRNSTDACKVVSGDITDSRFYVKVIDPTLSKQIDGSKRKGDWVEGGISVSNSEVGRGKFHVAPYARIVVCDNGMESDHAFSRIHVGKRIEVEELVAELLTDATRNLQDAALWSTIADVVRGSFDKLYFEKWVDQMNEATEKVIESRNVAKVVEVTREHYRLPDVCQDTILYHLAEGGDFTAWGLSNAVTRASQDVESYELAHEMESIGAKVIELEPKDWSVIATAGAGALSNTQAVVLSDTPVA